MAGALSRTIAHIQLRTADTLTQLISPRDSEFPHARLSIKLFVHRAGYAVAELIRLFLQPAKGQRH